MRLVLVLALFVAGCTAQASQPAPAPVPHAPAGTDSLWPQTPCPYWEVQVDTHLDPSWVDPISLALSEWDRILQGTFASHVVLTDRPQPYDQPAACVLAIAADPGLLVDEDARGYTDPTLVNDVTGTKFGHIRIQQGTTCTFVGCEALIIHELGHFIGLGHSAEAGSMMHVPLPVPPCITDDDAVGACAAWGACPQPVKRTNRCKSWLIQDRM